MPDPVAAVESSALLERLLAAEATLNRCDTRLHVLADELQRPAVPSLIADPGSSSAEVQTLRSELDHLRDAEASAREELVAAKGEAAAARAERDFLRDEVAELRVECERLQTIATQSHTDDAKIRHQLDEALDRVRKLEAEVEKARLAAPPSDGVPEPVARTPSWDAFEQMQSLVQQQMIELEQLRGAKKDLGRLLDEWRSKARSAQQRYKKVKERAEAAEKENDRLLRSSEKSRKASSKERAKELKEIDDLRKLVREQKRDLAVAEKREAHLRKKIGR